MFIPRTRDSSPLFPVLSSLVSLRRLEKHTAPGRDNSTGCVLLVVTAPLCRTPVLAIGIPATLD